MSTIRTATSKTTAPGGLAQDSSWLEEARGKAVKIIYRLLPHLPPHLDYRVLFMERDLNEVYDSQQDMLRVQRAPRRRDRTATNHPRPIPDLDAVQAVARQAIEHPLL